VRGGGGWGGDGGGGGVGGGGLNIPLVKVLKSYEVVLEQENLVPSEDTFFYREIHTYIDTATDCNRLQDTATDCNSCNRLQHNLVPSEDTFFYREFHM